VYLPTLRDTDAYPIDVSFSELGGGRIADPADPASCSASCEPEAWRLRYPSAIVTFAMSSMKFAMAE